MVWRRKRPAELAHHALVSRVSPQLTDVSEGLSALKCSAVILWMAQSAESDYEYNLLVPFLRIRHSNEFPADMFLQDSVKEAWT